MRPNFLYPVKCTEESFYRMWIEFLAPFHKLTSRERDVAARIIQQYFMLRERVKDPVLLKELLWSQQSRKDMRDSLGMSRENFQMVLKSLREANVLVDGDLNKAYIPNKGSEPRFAMCVLYDWSSDTNRVDEAKQG